MAYDRYLVKLWYRTQVDMPTVAQLRYALSLCETRRGVDEDELWSHAHSRKELAACIHELTKLPFHECDALCVEHGDPRDTSAI